MVAAKHQNGDYAVWTSWNEQIQSLNHGHYNLPDKKACVEIMTEYQTIHNSERSTPLECLQELFTKHNNNFEDSYQKIVYIMGFINGITAQCENKWEKMTQEEADFLFNEAVHILAS